MTHVNARCELTVCCPTASRLVSVYVLYLAHSVVSSLFDYSKLHVQIAPNYLHVLPLVPSKEPTKCEADWMNISRDIQRTDRQTDRDFMILC